jgi:hypothetical protein
MNGSSDQRQAEKDHKRQAFWQIYVPLCLGAAVFLALCVWVWLYTAGYVPEPGLPDQQTPAAKLAVIWLAFPTCLGGFFQLLFLGAFVFLLAKGIHALPPAAQKAENGIRRLSGLIARAADKLAAPVILVGSQKAGVDEFFRKLAFWKRSS